MRGMLTNICTKTLARKVEQVRKYATGIPMQNRMIIVSDDNLTEIQKACKKTSFIFRVTISVHWTV